MDRLLQDETGRMFTRGDGLADGQYADVGAEVIYHGQDNIAKLCQRCGLELSDHFSWERRLRSSNSLPRTATGSRRSCGATPAPN